ncbi:glucose-6-phosphate isomerase [Capnocytophaga sp. ARDL2]|uniref:glucose-6-phosphate isomerase n=1 Tax=Capnocytophaga sp. ARDL2 TaxID=3238809 RepID=UPI003558F360
MALLKINPTETKAWEKLNYHYLKLQYDRIQDFFSYDDQRVKKMHIEWKDILLDFSKNKITDHTLKLLFELANEVELKKGIEAMFSGEIINETEKRAVAHVALRDWNNQLQLPFYQEVQEALQKIKVFTENILSGTTKGSTGKAFTDVVNIGIGGSDLGPKMVVESLQDYKTHLHTHYISNIDYDAIKETLEKLNPETTLIIIVSKSFTTLETLTNADAIKNWIVKANLKTEDHLIAVSSAIDKAVAYGIDADNIFRMWDWVGGRFSLWSAVGLSIALAVGYEHFIELLKGAQEMDEHFLRTPFQENIPVILGLIGIWYANFFGYETEAIVPYSNRLASLPAYLQQVIMESNGKNMSREGYLVDYQTCNIVWGEIGTNSQHAFFQLFHQGSKIIPTDFIGFINPFTPSEMHHQLMANFFAQTEGLMNGKTGAYENTDNTDGLAKYRIFRGNRPTNTLLINKLTPKNIGSLLALYEHKTFVQGYIWNIYSFDQFGVEYGKQLAQSISNEIKNQKVGQHDASTSFLLEHYLKKQNR